MDSPWGMALFIRAFRGRPYSPWGLARQVEDSDGDTAMMLAAVNGHKGVLKLLKKATGEYVDADDMQV
eukprot:1180887-Prorocentrum_minimum.AAC.3